LPTCSRMPESLSELSGERTERSEGVRLRSNSEDKRGNLNTEVRLGKSFWAAFPKKTQIRLASVSCNA
jgi:hypothetical protein